MFYKYRTGDILCAPISYIMWDYIIVYYFAKFKNSFDGYELFSDLVTRLIIVSTNAASLKSSNSSSSLPLKQPSPLFFSQDVIINAFILFIAFFKNSIERHETHDRGFLFFNCKALLNLDSSGCVSPPLTVQTWVDFIWIVWLVNRNIKKDLASLYLKAVFSTKITIIVMLIRRKFPTWYYTPSREPFFSNNFWVLKCRFIHR